MKRLWLLLPLFIGFSLRFYGLQKQAFFGDEADTANLALLSWSKLLEFQTINHPRLYYFIIKIIIDVWPLTEWNLRWFSAYCSTLSLATTIGITRRLVGQRTAIGVGWLLAWSSLHLYHAQDAKMYSLLECLWLLSAWCLWQAHITQKRSWWLGWAISNSLAFHTHFFGLLLWGVGSLSSGLIILQQRSKRQFQHWLIAQTITLAALFPLILLITATITENNIGGTWLPNLTDLAELWLLTLLGFSPTHFIILNVEQLALSPWDWLNRTHWYSLLFLLTFGSLLGWWRLLAFRPHNIRLTGWLVITFGLLPLVVALILFNLTQQRLWAYRPFIGAMVWLLIGFSVGWSAFPRWLTYSIWLVILGLNMGGLIAFETHWIKDYSRSAFSQWANQVPPDTVLVLNRSYYTHLWKFYRHENQPTLVFGIAPRAKEGHYQLRRWQENDTLLGQSIPVTCADLPTNHPIALYDPRGTRFSEGEFWPSCLHLCQIWLFNPQQQTWEKSKENFAWCSAQP